MKSVHFSIIGFIFLMTGCVPMAPPVKYPAAPKQYPVFLHQYELLVVDVDDSPLSGVKVDYELKENGRFVESASSTTELDGKVLTSLTVNSDPNKAWAYYKSSINYTLSKNGYYIVNFTTSQYQRTDKVETIKMRLVRPADYLEKQFASTLSDTKLKENILKFVDLIVSKEEKIESSLQVQSIKLVPFRGSSHLQFKFKKHNQYNSLRLDKYGIGRNIFDEVVRKILSPLNEHVAREKLFYGYDLTIIAFTRDFSEKYGNLKTIEYRFIIPEAVARQYKNKDISGQQVLDASVILIDDERIELKLQ